MTVWYMMILWEKVKGGFCMGIAVADLIMMRICVLDYVMSTNGLASVDSSSSASCHASENRPSDEGKKGSGWSQHTRSH